ncbi:hypothetical protein [Methylobacter sp.]|uniref:hypothetical protein n=1 Tax=Methylobacter sp. TaxID=2051955 RepID=UPI001212BB39|nr:hypothetical protein [Methylobacter sp.]TAK64906.1 MAG: hypothetical protein EPO18_01655 [Methylobacter sp.]
MTIQLRAMDSELDLIKMRDEVLRKIGRNLLNFQKIELMLKHLITNGRMSGPMSEFKENQERRAAVVHKQTMGNLVGQFIENTFSEHDNSSQSTAELKEPYFSFSFTVDADADFYESKRQALKSLVDDRNDLIHHLLPRFNPESIDSCLEIEQYLDQQRERLIPEYDHLKSLIESFEEAKKIHADFLNSEEGIKQFKLSFLQQSPIVALLLNISTQQSRSDGWTLLSVTGPQIRRILPGELEQLKHKWEYKTLKELMLVSEFFEIIEEPTEKGGIRVLYRPKPELAYSAFNRLLNSLLDTSNRTARADGWTLLSTAIQQIEQTLAEDFALVKETYECESLKRLILESELFDFFEELSNRDTIYELYRPKTID